MIHDACDVISLYLAFTRFHSSVITFLQLRSRLQEEGHEHSSYGAVGHELGSKKGASIVESGESGRSDEALSLQSWSPPLWLQRLLAVFFYYVLGCAYYGASPTCQWDPAEVFYFVCISISTVG
jgi:hypothetical protein